MPINFAWGPHSFFPVCFLAPWSLGVRVWAFAGLPGDKRSPVGIALKCIRQIRVVQKLHLWRASRNLGPSGWPVVVAGQLWTEVELLVNSRG